MIRILYLSSVKKKKRRCRLHKIKFSNPHQSEFIQQIFVNFYNSVYKFSLASVYLLRYELSLYIAIISNTFKI